MPKRSERERLAELDEAVRATDAGVRQADAEAREATRAHARALVPLREYWRAVGAGERQRDEATEAELDAAVREVQGAMSMRPVLVGGKLSDLVPTDERLD